MPIYEYQCGSCGTQFELKRGIEQRDETAACPECRNEGKRMTSVFASSNGGLMQVPTRAFRPATEGRRAA